MKHWYGKYRGTVMGPGAPNEPAGSLMINVPEVMGATGSQLALPCFPYAGLVSGTFFVPPPKSAVWVEFEGGMPTKPIWVGGFYPTPAAPTMAKVAPPGTESVVIQTTLQNVLSITDVPGSGGIMLRASTGAMILINDTGIVLQDGKGGILTMTGGIVSVNPPNLVVLK
jgi:hypothetical protein